MEIVRKLNRPAYLLGAALALFGCAEQQPTAVKAKLDISRASAFNATIASTVTVYGEGGKVQQSKLSQQVRANFKNGMARATASGPKSFAVDGAVTSDGIVVAPVVAMVDGSESWDYDVTTVDSVGNVIRLIATGPEDGSPVTDAYAYVNGQLAKSYHSVWTPVYGGYVLSSQSLDSYTSGGAISGSIDSRIETSGVPQITSRDIGAKFAAFSRTTFDKVACALAPESAYAAPACTYEVVKFSGETIGLGIATAIFPWGAATAVVAAAGTGYVMGFGLWTAGLHDMLACINANGGAGGGTRQRGPLRK